MRTEAGPQSKEFSAWPLKGTPSFKSELLPTAPHAG